MHHSCIIFVSFLHHFDIFKHNFFHSGSLPAKAHPLPKYTDSSYKNTRHINIVSPQDLHDLPFARCNLFLCHAASSPDFKVSYCGLAAIRKPENAARIRLLETVTAFTINAVLPHIVHAARMMTHSTVVRMIFLFRLPIFINCIPPSMTVCQDSLFPLSIFYQIF